MINEGDYDRNIQVIVANPNYLLHDNRAVNFVVKFIQERPKYVVRNLNEEYRDFTIDIEKEILLLSKAKAVVFLFPLTAYYMPALLTQYVQSVFTSKGFMEAVFNKEFLIAVTALQNESVFTGVRSMEILLSSVIQTAKDSGLHYIGIVRVCDPSDDFNNQNEVLLEEACAKMVTLIDTNVNL
ncbi:flavodoxin-like fold family protein [Cryptosporidium muris RN66]|uniref:Flavodoxin-like fold family protein n=1 Tax=Cryptosporidium muris (strain RN66) TaxID=441375 RepID=B6ADV4_CRYMR|nr:flavodoxin-like fold family protein [Cryptosporidium muris RN66]EEA06395.1 flavodoxin-like fold family protein [Cryptosporidium muris RN66]|eukprot:XP_002140744.1 flavodoxin-like fold family protein [Cryptosporidium muris RN66]